MKKTKFNLSSKSNVDNNNFKGKSRQLPLLSEVVDPVGRRHLFKSQVIIKTIKQLEPTLLQNTNANLVTLNLILNYLFGKIKKRDELELRSQITEQLMSTLLGFRRIITENKITKIEMLDKFFSQEKEGLKKKTEWIQKNRNNPCEKRIVKLSKEIQVNARQQNLFSNRTT